MTIKKINSFAAFFILMNASVYANINQAPTFTIPGVSSFSRLSEQPILLSTGPNTPWTFSSIDMPYSKDTDLLDVSCTTDHCVSVGFYLPYSNLTMQEPLILSKTDTGWSFIKNIKNLPTINFGALTSLACNEKRCLIAGYYDNFNDHQVPALIITGHDKSWKVVDDISLPKGAGNSNLFSIKCLDDKTCFASGNALTNNQQLPLILASFNGGTSWSSATLNDFPKNSAATLTSIGCNHTTCFAGGYYVTNANKPILLERNNKSHSWSPIATTAYPSQLRGGMINNVKCEENMCVAIGNDIISNGSYKPLMLLSEDAGKNWQSADDQSGIMNAHYLQLKDMSCESNHCTLVGTFNGADNTQHPLILNVSELNYRWVVTKNDTYPFRSEDQTLNAISCKTNVCVTTGDSASFPSYHSPLVLESNDGGITWKRVNQFENMVQGSYTRFKTIA